MSQVDGAVKVYSLRKGAEPAPPGSIRVDRGTPWGNPYVIGKDGDRATVIEKYRRYARFRARTTPAWLDPLLDAPGLLCWCQSPGDQVKKPCHAEVLIELIQGRAA